MSNAQPSPYSAAVEATVDHLRQRIRELEADLAALREEITTDPRHSHATEMIRRNERLKADLQELRGLARTVVDGLRYQVPQSGTCDHQWCVAVRGLRTLVGGEG